MIRYGNEPIFQYYYRRGGNIVNLEIFEKMDSPRLRSYIEFLLRHYRVMDAFWFIYVAERFDQPIAERINEQVWKRVPAMAAKDLLKKI